MMQRHKDVRVTLEDGATVKFRLLVTPPPAGYGPDDPVQGYVIDEAGVHALTTVTAKQITWDRTSEIG